MSDFEYLFDGYFYTLISQNPQADEAWNQIHKHFPNCKIDFSAWASVKFQLKEAKFSIKKARRISKRQLDAILEELGI